MYTQDSFFGLSVPGQIGLLCISSVLFLMMLWVAKRLLFALPIWGKLTGGFVLFWLFVWCSPQVYYQYYHLLFDGLPHQWVIWPPRSPVEALQLMLFQGPHNLSAHSQGILGWLLLLVPFAGRK